MGFHGSTGLMVISAIFVFLEFWKHLELCPTSKIIIITYQDSLKDRKLLASILGMTWAVSSKFYSKEKCPIQESEGQIATSKKGLQIFRKFGIWGNVSAMEAPEKSQ